MPASTSIIGGLLIQPNRYVIEEIHRYVGTYVCVCASSVHAGGIGQPLLSEQNHIYILDITISTYVSLFYLPAELSTPLLCLQVALGNICCVNNFLGGLDEEWFRLVHVEIEAKAARAVSAILHYVEKR